jgi:hypothetical protein
VLAARGAVDQQHARRGGWILLPALGLRHLAIGLAPLHRQLIRGVGKARAGRPFAWGFAGPLVRIPGNLGKPVNFNLLGAKAGS